MKSGYRNHSVKTKIGIDLDRWTWKRKFKYWKNLQLVTPSHWLSGLVAQSPLTSSWPCLTIKNPIDTNFGVVLYIKLNLVLIIKELKVFI